MASRAQRFELVDASWMNRLDRAHWMLLLKPHADFFEKRGFKLKSPAPETTWLEDVRDLIVKYEAELPVALAEALSYLVPISNEEAHNQFLGLVKKHGLSIPRVADLTDAEMAVVFYVQHIELFMGVYTHEHTSKPTNFCEYFDPLAKPFETLVTPENLSKLSAMLGKHFELRKWTPYNKISSTMSGQEMSLLVVHGHVTRSMGVIDPETLKNVQIRVRPSKHDVIHWEKGTGRLSINTAHREDGERIRQLLGFVFFNDANHFSAKAGYTGAPLFEDGKAALSTEGIPELESVKLIACKLGNITNHKKRKLSFEDEDLTDLLPYITEVATRADTRRFEMVRLSVKVKGEAKATTVTFHSTNKIHVTRRAGLEAIYKFLKLRGFSIAPTPIEAGRHAA
jgi:hypothetical protein